MKMKKFTNQQLKDMKDYGQSLGVTVSVTSPNKLLNALISGAYPSGVHIFSYNPYGMVAKKAKVAMENKTKNKLHGMETVWIDINEYQKEDIESYMLKHSQKCKNFVIEKWGEEVNAEMVKTKSEEIMKNKIMFVIYDNSSQKFLSYEFEEGKGFMKPYKRYTANHLYDLIYDLKYNDFNQIIVEKDSFDGSYLYKYIRHNKEVSIDENGYISHKEKDSK
jgi:hypothetical protein